MRKELAVVLIALIVLNAAFVYLLTNDPVSSFEISAPLQQQEQGQQYSLWSPEEPEIRRVPQFTEIKKFRSSENGTVYGDVLSHAPSVDNRDNRGTTVHETAHGIHSYLRNNHRGRNNGFYAREGRAVIIDEPNMRKSQVAKFVPQNLRSYRYSLYIAGQWAWDDTPLYIYDELTCYVLGGMTHVEDAQNGRKAQWSDGVSGCLGFSIYAIATCMAIKEYDPDYWENNEQFRNYTIWILRQAEETFRVGREMPQLKWDKQDKLFDELMANKTYEKFARENLDGVWFENPVALVPLDYESHQKAVLTEEDAKDEYRSRRP
jgi:hypothetical protein